MLRLEIAGARAELDVALAHRVHLRHDDRQGSRMTEGNRRHQRSQPNARGFASEPGHCRPHVGRAGPAVTREGQVVVGQKEPAVAEFFG